MNRAGATSSPTTTALRVSLWFRGFKVLGKFLVKRLRSVGLARRHQYGNCSVAWCHNPCVYIHTNYSTSDADGSQPENNDT